jgi:hypothetical protein
LTHGTDRIEDECHRRLGELPGRFAIGILDDAERIMQISDETADNLHYAMHFSLHYNNAYIMQNANR